MRAAPINHEKKTLAPQLGVNINHFYLLNETGLPDDMKIK